LNSRTVKGRFHGRPEPATPRAPAREILRTCEDPGMSDAPATDRAPSHAELLAMLDSPDLTRR
jgi:hypothetical protein